MSVFLITLFHSLQLFSVLNNSSLFLCVIGEITYDVVTGAKVDSRVGIGLFLVGEDWS